MSIMNKKSWRQHANPLSVWTRILSHPLLYVPFWNRSWWQGGLVAAWFALNPILFSETKDEESWASKGVLGEQLWLEDVKQDMRNGDYHLDDPSLTVNGLGGPSILIALYYAYQRRFWPMAAFGVAAFLLKLWYFDRMTFYYDQHKGREA